MMCINCSAYRGKINACSFKFMFSRPRFAHFVRLDTIVSVKDRFVHDNVYGKKPSENYKVQSVFLILFYLGFIL